MRGIPDSLFCGEFGRFDPVYEQGRARREAHSLEHSVEKKQCTDEINSKQSHLALGVKYAHQSVHLRKESYDEVDNGRKKQTGSHKDSLALEPVGEESVEES